MNKTSVAFEVCTVYQTAIPSQRVNFPYIIVGNQD
jgi:hypothetical protein